MINLFLHELRVRRGAILGWTIGLGFFSVIYMIIYPALPAEVREIDVRALALLESLGIQTLATFEGFIMGTEFNSHWLMAFVFMALSLFLGAYLPTRGAALSAAAAALLVSFFGDNLAGMAPVLEPYQPLFPHSYFERVVKMLTGDVAWRDMAILALIGLGFLVLAVLSFQRRNLTVGAWPWQRPKPPASIAARPSS